MQKHATHTYTHTQIRTHARTHLKTEFGQIDKDIDVLIAEMRKAIASSDEFIESLQSAEP